jgi:hypothetical protein
MDFLGQFAAGSHREIAGILTTFILQIIPPLLQRLTLCTFL